MTFDSFGDRGTRGYLRNRVGTNDAALKAAPTVSYDQVLDTHRRLFSSVYPWAGQDRAMLAPDIAIAKGGVTDLFSHPADVRRATDYALEMGLDARSLRARPGEVFDALACAHPFLENNGRTLMTVHADLTRRAGFHVDWTAIAKPEFLAALTAELRQPEPCCMEPPVAPGTGLA